MGIGPAVAIPKLLQKTGISKEEIDFFEVGTLVSLFEEGIQFDDSMSV
jgi:acetyl-CoA acetyltransferase